MRLARSNAEIECVVAQRAEVRRRGVRAVDGFDSSLARVSPNGSPWQYDIDATAVRNRRPMKELSAA